LEVLKKSDVAFTRVQLDTVGKSVVQTLTNALWYIDPHVQKLFSRGIQLPALFAEFQGFNDWKAKKQKDRYVYVNESLQF
jgi:hypothetical protein